MSTPESLPEIDIEQPDALIAYLRERALIGKDESPRVTVLAGGVSNKTVLVERESGEAWVLKQALAKLRVKVDWFSDPRRIHIEARALRALPPLTPPDTIPDFVFEDETHHILAMRAVPQPHDNWKTLLLRGEVKFSYVHQFAEILATMHSRTRRAEQPEIAEQFADRSFFESLRLEPYYAYTGTQVSGAADFMTALIEDTRKQQIALVHGDYSPKNILVYRDRLTHREKLILLDHEVIHYGDPAFDIGFAMTHLLSKAHHLPEKRKRFAEAAYHFWWVYWVKAGPEVIFAPLEEFERRAVRHLTACLLARAAGRSPLEYLSPEERERQIHAGLQLIKNAPEKMMRLIHDFVAAVE
jgi:5-methylthioribose kinase